MTNMKIEDMGVKDLNFDNIFANKDSFSKA
jgi:hypothetical protein